MLGMECNKISFKHYIIRKRRSYENKYDIYVYLVIPITVAFIIIIYKFNTMDNIILAIMLGFEMICLWMKELFNIKEHIVFINDILEICENIKNTLKKLKT